MTVTLERIIYGSPDATGEPSLLAASDHLTPQDAALWRGITSLKPMNADGFRASRAFGIFAGPAERFVMACAYQAAGKPYCEYLIIPRDLLVQLAGNLAPLLALFDKPFDDTLLPVRAASVRLSAAEPWTPQARRAQVEALLARGLDMPRALLLLGAALHERGLMIHDFPADTEARLSVVRGLMALLPARARAELTFSTNRHEKTITQARVVFAPGSIVTGRWIANWQEQTFPDDDIASMTYIRRLTALWHGDLSAFLSAIDQMDSMAASLLVSRPLQNSLSVMAERHALDARILANEDVPPEALKAVMKDIPPEGDLKKLYARRLLRHALDARDADAAQIVARAMDEDPELDHWLWHDLERNLYGRPDAVYSFVRARLSAGISDDEDARWSERLKVAALASLRVAILDGDAETAINWLRLVAREPASYDLGEVVHAGILAAQERARTEPELAQAVMLLAVRRDPAALDMLLADEALLAALPNGLGRALRGGEGDPVAVQQSYGVETFLVALARALETRRPDLFTPESIEQVWTIYSAGAANTSPYNAAAVIERMIASGASWLPALAVETLLGLMLRDKRDDLSHQMIHQLRERDDFIVVVVGAVAASERSDSDLLALIAQMIAVGDLTQQQALDVYVGLLVTWDWRKSALEMMEQLARTIQQHANLEIQPEVIWHLLAVAAEQKQEFITRITLKRLLGELEKLNDEEALAEDLQRLTTLIAWSSAARAQLFAWWRSYVREYTTAGLQRLDKALSDGARVVDDLRMVVLEVLAFRRMLGKRTLAQFAEDVSVAYTVLQSLAESFDPTPKRASLFDPAIMRMELDARSDELSPHELKILANNFKELAQLVTSMADNRSKATLMRRGDDLDRQLMAGEQQPHSAVDALKWMAGYLGGTQEKTDEAAE
jgi:hypothetical protein